MALNKPKPPFTTETAKQEREGRGEEKREKERERKKSGLDVIMCVVPDTTHYGGVEKTLALCARLRLKALSLHRERVGYKSSYSYIHRPKKKNANAHLRSEKA